jgi:hypothetical protein
MSTKQNHEDIQYDDELDEDFVEKLAEKSTTEQLQTTLDSFDNPQGLETAKDSSLMDGPQIDLKDINNLKKKMESMPHSERMALLASILKNNNFGLGAKENLSKVTGDHLIDASARLRAAIARKGSQRKSKVALNFEIERHQATNKELHRIDGKDGEPSPLEPEPHIHSYKPSDDETKEPNDQALGKNAKRNKKRRDAAKKKA